MKNKIILLLLIAVSISSCQTQHEKYKLITPWGNQIFSMYDENVPYIDYDTRFYKGDTTIMIKNKQVYKLVKL